MASNSVQESDSPKDIVFDSIVVDVDFHPSKNVIAAGDIDGEVTVHSYSTTEKNHSLMTLTHHKKACRAIKFSPDGNTLFTVSKDKSLCSADMDKGALSHKIKKAHSAAIYSMLVVDDNIVATGDDDGHLKVWDMRTRTAVMEIKDNEEFISDMVIDNTNRYLLSTSGDGTLTCFDIRKHKMKMQSELFDSEMLSLALMKGEEKIVVGTGEGVINIFNWGEWSNISDRFPGHPLSVDCMVPITDSLMCTGSLDGVVRAVHILPNRIVGTIGEHKDFPVENLSLCHDRKYIASCSHDQRIKFWNIENIDKEMPDTHRKKIKKSNKQKPVKSAAASSNFFADLVEPKEDSSEQTNEKERSKTTSTEKTNDEDSESDMDDSLIPELDVKSHSDDDDEEDDEGDDDDKNDSDNIHDDDSDDSESDDD